MESESAALLPRSVTYPAVDENESTVQKRTSCVSSLQIHDLPKPRLAAELAAELATQNSPHT